MTEQERIDALAEALHDTARPRHIGMLPDLTACTGSAVHEEDAAAILAALPPDWCGHEVEGERLAREFVEKRYREVIERARRTNVPAERMARRLVEEDDARRDAETGMLQAEIGNLRKQRGLLASAVCTALARPGVPLNKCAICDGEAMCEADGPAIVLAAGMFVGASEDDLRVALGRGPMTTDPLAALRVSIAELPAIPDMSKEREP